MPTSIAQARDDVLTLIADAADDLGIPMVWEGTAGSDKPSTDDPQQSWARAGFQHVARRQTTIVGSDGNRRFTSYGLVSIQLFTPPADGLADADPTAEAFRNAIEGKSTANGVWFRNARTIEVGLSGGWWQTNILADFEYDEIR